MNNTSSDDRLLERHANGIRNAGRFRASDLLSLIIWVGIVAVIMLLGNLAGIGSNPEWYDTLNKPPFTPPSWVFAPVWTAIYLMMAIAIWNIWRRKNEKGQRKAVLLVTTVFCIQLFLNVVWSFIFFGLQSPMFAFIEICILWVAIAFTVFLSLGRSK